MSITARTLVEDALQDCGVLDPIETMSAEQADHGLRSLNRIIDGWRARRLYVYTITDVAASFSGASATVGSGLTVNTDAPVRFEPGCYYVKDGATYPLSLLDAQGYASIQGKADQGDPVAIYYDRAIPGNVYVWPVPTTSRTYHFLVMRKLSAFADLDTTYSLPDGYQDALHWTLCERIPRAYNMPVSAADVAEAAKARAAIMRANTTVPILSATPDSGARINIING